MFKPLIDTPEALDAAIAASRHARRETLLRAARNQRLRTRIGFVLSGSAFICALIAFAAGDREAAALVALMACVSFSVTYVAGKAGQKKAIDSLHEMDRST